MIDYFYSIAQTVERHATQARHLIEELLAGIANEENA